MRTRFFNRKSKLRRDRSTTTKSSKSIYWIKQIWAQSLLRSWHKKAVNSWKYSLKKANIKHQETTPTPAKAPWGWSWHLLVTRNEALNLRRRTRLLNWRASSRNALQTKATTLFKRFVNQLLPDTNKRSFPNRNRTNLSLLNSALFASSQHLNSIRNLTRKTVEPIWNLKWMVTTFSPSN